MDDLFFGVKIQFLFSQTKNFNRKSACLFVFVVKLLAKNELEKWTGVKNWSQITSVKIVLKKLPEDIRSYISTK